MKAKRRIKYLLVAWFSEQSFFQPKASMLGRHSGYCSRDSQREAWKKWGSASWPCPVLGASFQPDREAGLEAERGDGDDDQEWLEGSNGGTQVEKTTLDPLIFPWPPPQSPAFPAAVVPTPQELSLHNSRPHRAL